MSFYSPIDRLAQTLPRPKGTGSEFMTELSKMPGYKAQEVEDRGLQALVNLPKMERAQFLEALKNKPPVTPETRMLQTPHHEHYTLPGGENYREFVLRHPKGKFEGVEHHFGGTPNILASVRAKDRTGPNGEKIFHIEELQSDWHQQGRNEGYAEDLTPEEKKEYENIKNLPSIEFYHPKNKVRYKELIKKISGIPNAPFKKNWHEMALKKMIHHAAKSGYDAIAITPGAEQADRYSLAKQVGQIAYTPATKQLMAFDHEGNAVVHENNVAPEDLEKYIGKDVAEKLIKSEWEGPSRILRGDNIKVGGEGMKGFYDKIIPSFLNQFGKKYGAQVGAMHMPVNRMTEDDVIAQFPGGVHDAMRSGDIGAGRYIAQKLKEHNKPVPVHHFPITPKMREDVTKNGVPLYAKGGEVEVKPTNYDPNLQRKHPELEAAIRGVAAGTTTHKQLDKLIAKHKPIKPYEFVPQPATDEDAERALKPAQKPKWRGHEQWPAGRKVGLRLDIPAYESHGVWVNSVHDEEGKGDDNLKVAYGPVSSVKNAVFDPTPHKAEEVGMGEKGKSSFARIKGDLHHMSEDEAVDHMKAYLNHPDYAQVGFDPRRHGFFYDRKTMKPVTHSAHVVQIGPLVLAHKPTYGKRENYAKGGDIHAGGPAMGINVRSDKKANLQYADLIVDGKKTYESRNGDTLRPYVGKRVSIVRTGDGPAKAIGAVTVGEPMVVNRKKFREMEQHHLVPEGSAFDIASETKHLYPMHDPERYESERDVGHGIVARKVHMAKGGAVKPVGYTKERVTVSPNLDAMRYELESVKHYSKKVK